MVVDILLHAFMITGFVFIMMLVIEYIHVQTRGDWQERLTGSRWGQYIMKKSVPSREILVPVPEGILGEIKEVAESVRQRDIPKLIKI